MRHQSHIVGSLTTASLLFVLNACAMSAESSGVRYVSNAELTMEKNGRVVDSASGAGVPNAKIIVNWRTISTGVPGYSSTGGTWCDLQRVVTSDNDGNYKIPDVSKELGLSDRGTHAGETAFGIASQTHDKDFVVTVFKSGYVARPNTTGRELQGAVPDSKTALQENPSTTISSGQVIVSPLTMAKVELPPPELWGYYSSVSVAGICSDRMARNVEQPEVAEIRESMKQQARAMPCNMAADYPIPPDVFAVFENVAESPSGRLRFHNKVRELQGLPPPTRGYDPTERISTTAGVVCHALQAENTK